ncbi:hypothetical protein EXS71_03995 [Candidatus Uhrbacteria bacterium]|nr:hypothetical protein [Candidatus Uhrbacteria bacterium]
MCFVGAYLSATASHHTVCTQEVQTRDGRECVGDYIGVKGPDMGNAFILALVGMCTSWYAVVDRKDEQGEVR